MNETSHTQSELTYAHLADRDFESVRELIDESSNLYNQMSDCQAAALVWLSALRLFRKKEIRLGLPEVESDRLVYGMMIAALRSTGKAILINANKLGDQALPYSMTWRDFEAYVDQLYVDDAMNETPLTAKDTEILAELFADEHQASSAA